MPSHLAALQALRSLPPCRVVYRVPWWAGLPGRERRRFQGRLSVERKGATTRAHWLAFSPSDFRPVVDKLLVIDDSARILEYSTALRRRVFTNGHGTSDAYAGALEFAGFCLELVRRYGSVSKS